MSRHTFGGSIADYAVAPGAQVTVNSITGNQVLLVPGAQVTFWDSPSAGTQITDLLDSTDTPVTFITTDANGAIPEFQGPDTVPETLYMWADGGTGERVRVIAVDLADALASVSADHTAFSDLEAFFRTGATGQMLSPDPDPASEFGIRWIAPPTGSGGGSSASGYIGVDVTQSPYSADKTGAVDARAVIQQAINDVSALGGGQVILPPGTYSIGYPGLQGAPNVWVRGAGKESTLLQATGTWASEAGLINIGSLASSANVWRFHVSHMWLKGTSGTSFASSPPSNISGIVLNSSGVTWDSDACHHFHDLLLWDFDRGIIVYGTDDQAINFERIRIRHTLRQGVLVGKEDGSGGGADCYYTLMDVSSGNQQSGGTYAGWEIYGTNNQFLLCGSWFHKRGTAFTAGQDYKDGSGWFIKGTRNAFTGCQAQDNAGHGFLLRLGKNVFEGCRADSSNYLDNISGSAGQYECSGWYIGAGASDVVIAAAQAYNRSSYSQLQKNGFTIDATTRNVYITGNAWDNKSSSGAADPLDGLVWINGAAHSSHEVKLLTAFGSTRTTISNGTTASASSGAVAKRKGSGDEVTVTGTTLTSDNVLTASVPGGARYYKVEALILYRADATDDAKIGLATAIVAGSGTVDCHWQPQYTAAGGTAAAQPYELSQVGTTRSVVADGQGGVTGSGFTNQMALSITGILYVGTTVTTGSLTVQVAANGTAGNTGIKVKENSWLSVTPFTFS